MTEEVVGFTEKQRNWFKKRDGNQCMFHYFENGKWKRCCVTAKLQVHHILPRGWCRLHMPHSFQVNGSMNGICICKYHHVGKGSVHPDTYEALIAYQQGNKQSFKEMVDKRKELNEQGIPYWNTSFDWQFMRLVKRHTARYTKIEPYPVNGNRGNTGRIQDSKKGK